MGVIESKPVRRVHAVSDAQEKQPKIKRGVNSVAGRRTVLRSGSSRGRRLALEASLGIDEIDVQERSDTSDQKPHNASTEVSKNTAIAKKSSKFSMTAYILSMLTTKKKKSWQERAKEGNAKRSFKQQQQQQQQQNLDATYNTMAEKAKQVEGLLEATKLQKKANSEAFKQGSYRPERDGSFKKKKSRLRLRESRRDGLSIAFKMVSARKYMTMDVDDQSDDLQRIHSQRRRMALQKQRR